MRRPAPPTEVRYLPTPRCSRQVQAKSAKDTFEGKISGAGVCSWFGTLSADVQTINSAQDISYKGGPNSSSVLRYLLESLPDMPWYFKPFMNGYASSIPGVN